MSSDENRHSGTATPPLPTFAIGAVAVDIEPLTRDVESVSLDDWISEQTEDEGPMNRCSNPGAASSELFERIISDEDEDEYTAATTFAARAGDQTFQSQNGTHLENRARDTGASPTEEHQVMSYTYPGRGARQTRTPDKTQAGSLAEGMWKEALRETNSPVEAAPTTAATYQATTSKDARAEDGERVDEAVVQNFLGAAYVLLAAQAQASRNNQTAPATPPSLPAKTDHHLVRGEPEAKRPRLAPRNDSGTSSASKRRKGDKGVSQFERRRQRQGGGSATHRPPQEVARSSTNEVREVRPPPRPEPEVISLLDDSDDDEVKMEDIKPRMPACDGADSALRLGQQVCLRIVQLRFTGDFRTLVSGEEMSWREVARELELEEGAARDVRKFDEWLTRRLMETGLGWRAVLRGIGFRHMKLEE